MEKIKSYVKLLRIKHWIKNLFVVAPLLFSMRFSYFDSILLSVAGFLSFCFISSSVYCINDIIDIEKDKMDPIKSKRPIASGDVSKNEGIILSLILFLLSFLILYLFKANYVVYLIILFYFVLNILYSLKIKTYLILDVISISLGFVLRVYAGSKIIGVSSSIYLLLTTFFFSLFLGFEKRRKELDRIKIEPSNIRAVLAKYETKSLDYMVIASSIFSVMTYSLYTISDDTIARFGTTRLIYSVPFVVYGIFRYFYDIYSDDKNLLSGDPAEIVFMDKYIQIDVILWILFIFFVIYKK